jgi:hypothetical protein
MTTIRPQSTPENAKLILDLGRFTIVWSIFDTILDAAIMKLLRLSANEAAIVTCSLSNSSKVSIVRSLLHHQNPNHPAIAKLSTLVTEAGRNAVMHGSVLIGDASMSFLKMDVSNKLTAKSKDFAHAELSAKVGDMAKQCDEIQALLGISEAERASIPQIAKTLSTKSDISP